MVKIFIDPGHGGRDPGAVGNGLQEKNVNFQIAKKIDDILRNEYTNVTTLMSRTGDQTVSLDERTNAANNWGADYFLSIHCNSGGGTGFESFVYPGSGAQTTTYQQNIHSEVMKVNQLTDRGMKQANLHVLRETNMSALLTENGFIDHASDSAKMKSASWLDAVARGHVNGLARSFNLQKKNVVYHTVVQGDTVYSLSQKYGSTIYQIKEWNQLDDQFTIYIGQVLRVK